MIAKQAEPSFRLIITPVAVLRLLSMYPEKAHSE